MRASPSRVVFWLSLLCLCAPGVAFAGVKKAKKKLHKQAKQQIASLHDESILAVKELDLTLDLLALKIQLGSLEPADAALQATAAAADAVRGAEVLARATLSQVEAFASGQLENIGHVPRDWRLGGLGIWDQFLADLEEEVRFVDQKLGKRLRQFTDAFSDAGVEENLILRHVAPRAPERIAPGAGAAPQSTRPVHVFAVAAASRPEETGDGFACVAGEGDPDANGGIVDVTLTDGAGFTQSRSVSLDSEGRFTAGFPVAGLGPLLEGNYLVVVSQGGPPVVVGLSVP